MHADQKHSRAFIRVDLVHLRLLPFEVTDQPVIFQTGPLEIEAYLKPGDFQIVQTLRDVLWSQAGAEIAGDAIFIRNAEFRLHRNLRAAQLEFVGKRPFIHFLEKAPAKYVSNFKRGCEDKSGSVGGRTSGFENSVRRTTDVHRTRRKSR